MTQQTVRRERADGLVGGRLEEMEQYLEDVVFGYRSRKTEVNHIMDKLERAVKEANEREEHKTVKAVAELEEEVSKRVRLSGEDIGQTKTLLAEFISKEWLYFNQILQCQAQDEDELLQLIHSTTHKRMNELRGLVAKEKQESAEGPSIAKLRASLRQKCDFLQNQLALLKDNTSKCKKEVTKQVKAMLRVLQQLQQHRQDRQAKQECVLGHIDQMIA